MQAAVIVAPTSSSSPSTASSSSTTSTAASWQVPLTVTIAALVALVATVPLATMIAVPIRGLVDAAPGSPGSAMGLAFMLVGPLGYLLFVATAWAALKDRAESVIFSHTMRTAAIGLAPYVLLSLVGIGWQAGPRLPLLVAAALTLPAAAVGTIWASAQTR